MYDEESKTRRFYAVSYENDIPNFSLGALIPPDHGQERKSTKPARALNSSSNYKLAIIPAFILLGAGLLLSSTAYLMQNDSALMASLSSLTKKTPVVIQHPYTQAQTPFNYGVHVAMTEPDFFAETSAAFMESKQDFIEVDLSEMKLRYFEEGEQNGQFTVLNKGEKGTWCETPAGLYEIKSKNEDHFSSFGQVHLPWSLGFQGNFFIHGWPYYESGAPVEDEFAGGCIRLSNKDAETLFGKVKVDTPVLVYEKGVNSDSFVYEPKIPELETPHYLLADVESSTVLASSELDDMAPIASLTKLMTAVVATEYINLDKDVWVNQPSFVQSLVPRLGDRSQVSMYSLMQLLLVESSNEAAQVIASQVGEETFVKYMNEKAASLGLTHTVFADPSGLSAGNVSSLGDLLRLTQYIYNHRRFILDMTVNQDLPTAYVSGQFGELNNFNKVEDLENFVGGKVGETLAAGQTSITLHRLKVKGQERTLAIILLGSSNRGDDVRELLNYAEERFGY